MHNKYLDKGFQAQVDYAVALANNTLDKLHGSLANHDAPDFGSGMLRCDDKSVIFATIAHRVLSKYERPIPDREKHLERECFNSWLAYEDSLNSYNLYERMNEHKVGKSTVYRARLLIESWLANFEPGSVQFTPGEVFTTSRGKCSIYQKLRQKKFWEVTHDAADSFIRLCYNNLSLKRCAKSFFKKRTKEEYHNMFFDHQDQKCIGFSIFRQRMYEEVLTLVHGSRGSSVPKDNEKRRFINVEPLCNVILQRQVGLGIRAICANIGNNLEIGQDVHKSRISSPNVSTIDFSNASDSTITKFCEFFLPARFMKRYIMRYRSPMTLIDDVFYVPNKVSSMGNGFTFELMTLILLALARVNDPYATVYGDDVICSNDSAATFIEAAAIAGYKVNPKKTFVNSRFRESCGAFFLDGYGYITCYNIKYCNNIADVITTGNKLRLIAEKSTISYFWEAYESFVSCVPSLFKGPVDDNNLTDFFGIVDYNQKQIRRSKLQQLLVRRIRERYALQLASLQYSHFSVLLIPFYESKVVSTSPQDIKSPARYASYLYSMRRSKDVNRNEGSWCYRPALVQDDGKVISLAELEKLFKADAMLIAQIRTCLARGRSGNALAA